jgi:hypothetical protein
MQQQQFQSHYTTHLMTVISGVMYNTVGEAREGVLECKYSFNGNLGGHCGAKNKADRDIGMKRTHAPSPRHMLLPHGVAATHDLKNSNYYSSYRTMLVENSQMLAYTITTSSNSNRH